MSELIITSLGEIFHILSYHTSCGISLWQSCINSGCVYLCDISEKQTPAQHELMGIPNLAWSFCTPSISTPLLSAAISTLLTWTLIELFCENHNIHVVGISDVWRCSCRLHPGRMGPAGHIPEKTVQRRDAGKYQSSGLRGWVCQQLCMYAGE